MLVLVNSDPATALGNAADFFISVLWPNIVNMVTGNYYLMLFLFGGLLASAFRFIRIARDSVD